MAQGDPASGGAGTCWLHAPAHVVHAADVVEVVRETGEKWRLRLQRGLGTTRFLLLLFLETSHRPGAEERRPKATEITSTDEGLTGTPPVGVLTKDIVDKLGEDDSRLLHPLQVRVTEVGLQEEPFDSRDGLVPGMDKG